MYFIPLKQYIYWTQYFNESWCLNKVQGNKYFQIHSKQFLKFMNGHFLFTSLTSGKFFWTVDFTKATSVLRFKPKYCNYSPSLFSEDTMASNDIGDWYRGIPQMTKYWFTGSVVVPIVARFGLLNPAWLFLHFESFIYKFQVNFSWHYLAVLFYPHADDAPSSQSMFDLPSFLLGTRQDSTDLLAVLILLIWGTRWPTSVFEYYRQAVPL